MKNKFLLFIIPLFFIIILQGCTGSTADKAPVPADGKETSGLTVKTNVQDISRYDYSADTYSSNPTTEIMPAWPPVTEYNKNYLSIKQRKYLNPTTKMAYLTLDDGPSPATPRILDILKAKNVKATFFNVGTQIKKYPQYLKMEFEQGHAIGNHTWDHIYANIYKSPESLLEEATKTNDLIEQVIGVRTPLFRPPGGSLGNFTVGSWNIMDANNYIVYDWNVSSYDASPVMPSKQAIVNSILNQCRNKDTAIILMHDNEFKTSTIQALPEVIDGLAREGFTFGILSPDVRPSQFMQGSLQAAVNHQPPGQVKKQ